MVVLVHVIVDEQYRLRQVTFKFCHQTCRPGSSCKRRVARSRHTCRSFALTFGLVCRYPAVVDSSNGDPICRHHLVLTRHRVHAVEKYIQLQFRFITLKPHVVSSLDHVIVNGIRRLHIDSTFFGRSKPSQRFALQIQLRRKANRSWERLCIGEGM